MKLIKKIGFSKYYKYIEKKIYSSKYFFYEILNKELPQSIFCILGINFFNKMVENKIFLFLIIKNKNKILLSGIITVVNLD